MRIPAIALLLAASVSANVLTFDANLQICSENPDGSGANVVCAIGRTINQTYGDESNVNVSYLGTGGTTDPASLYYYSTGYSDLTDVAYYSGTVNRIIIDPLPGYTVTLSSFLLGRYPGTQNPHYLRVVELDTNVVLNDYGLPIISDSLHSAFTPNASSSIGLMIDMGSSISGGPAFDDVTFTVTPTPEVPEPGTMGLLGMAMAAVCLYRLTRTSAPRPARS